MTLEKEFKRLNNQLENLSTRKENEVARIYALVLRDIRKQLSVIYSKYEQNGKVTWDIMTKYERLKKLEDDIRKRILVLDNEIKLLTYGHLKDVYQESYYTTAYLIEKESQAKLAYSAVKADVIEQAIQNNFTGLTLNERLQRRRNDLIINMREQITRGLHNGDTYSQMVKRIKGELENDVVKARRIVRTEAHRIRETASYESALHADKRGVKMVKTWNSVNDERSRDSHRQMDGKTVPVDKDFVLPSGATGEAPGRTGSAREDINCRCFASYEVVAIEKPKHGELEGITYSDWKKSRVS